jgi:hypothetical protein
MAAPAVLARKAHWTISAHYWATLLMVAALAPALRMAGLPLRFTWAEYFRDYWGFLVSESIIGGVILYVLGAPVTDSLGPLFRRYSRQKLRLIFILPMVLILMLTLGIRAGLLASVATIVMLEIKERAEENHISLLKMTSDIFWPVAYGFVGGVVTFAYNEVIAALRYNVAADFVLKRWDSVLLGGHSVSGFAHAFIGRWPGSVPWMELIYFGMFAQTGGCLTILALTEGRRRALQYIGTVLVAFYIALAFFYLWPATGPYASCANHFSVVPDGPVIYHLQRLVLVTLERFRSGPPLSAIGRDYYIALPSMHFVQTLIAVWFLRRWKRLLILMIAFDVLLVPAILLLEMHYLVDLIAAVPVAALAIAISGRDTLTSTATSTPRT